MMCEEERNDRAARLNRVKYIIKLYESRFKTRILNLQDDKGGLIVSWETEPYTEEKEFVESFWGLENEYIVEHVVGVN